MNNREEEEGYGAVRAIDPKTGERKWEFKMTDVTDGGVLTTASDLLFSGGREGYFFALDARTGALFWKANVGVRLPRVRSHIPSADDSTLLSPPEALFSRTLCGNKNF